MTNRQAFTLMELLVYLALASAVMLMTTTFLVRLMGLRAVAATETTLQENARTIVDQLTYSIRNAYQVEVDGSNVTIAAHPAENPEQTKYTVYQVDHGVLVTGVGDNPATITADPITNNDILVETFIPSRQSSALHVQLTLKKGQRSTTMESTIAIRQQP